MRALVLLSGGISSTVLVAHGIHHNDDVQTLTLAYGQHNAEPELAAATAIADWYHVPHHVVHVPDVFGPSALFDDEPLPTGLPMAPDATLVVGRNMVFLAIATAFAHRVGCTSVWYGPVAEDHLAYADTGWKFIEAIEEAAYQGSGGTVRTAAPVRSHSLRQVVELGVALDVPFELTWSCHDAGPLPCGVCGSCSARQEAMRGQGVEVAV